MSVTPDTQLGDRWVRAIAAGDEPAVLAGLDPSVDFGALTPGRAWEASTAADVAEIVLGRWFAVPRRIAAIDRIEHATIGGRQRVGYLFRATTPDGNTVIEQQAYFDAVDDRITWLRILCTGFRSTD